VLNLKDATSIREALRMIADDPDTPKRECKPAVKVIEVAAEIVAADMPAVEVIEPVATVKPVAKVKPPAIDKPVAAKPAKANPVRYLYTLGERGDDVIHYIYRHHISKQNGSVVELSGRVHGDTYQESFLDGTRTCKKSVAEVFQHHVDRCNPYEDDDLQPNCNGQYYTKQLDLSCMQTRDGGGQYCYFEPGDRCYYDETAMNLILARNAKRLESQPQ
jgi:hypothetical protein